MKKLLFIFLMLAVLTGCHGLRMGVGLKGEVIDEDTLVLDGDTFTIQERIGDSLFIVWNYEHSDEKTPCYLLKYERNGFYYPQIGATNITSIDNTVNYVSIDDNDVYDIKDRKILFSSPGCESGFYYLGQWKAYIFSQVLIRFASLMENVLDSKMMCFVANIGKKVW